MNDEHTHRVLWVERGSCQNSAEIHWKSGEDEFHQSYNNRRDAQTRLSQLAQQLGQSAQLLAFLALINEYIPSTGHEDGDIWITRGLCQNSAQINWQAAGHVYNQSHNNRRDAYDRVGELIRGSASRVSIETLRAAINEYIPSTGHEDGDIWITRGLCQNSAQINWQTAGHVYNQSHNNRRDAQNVVTQLAKSLGSTASLARLQESINEFIPGTGREDGDVWITSDFGPGSIRVNWQRDGHIYHPGQSSRETALTLARYLSTQAGVGCPEERLRQELDAINAR